MEKTSKTSKKRKTRSFSAGKEFDLAMKDLIQKCDFAKKIGNNKIKKAVLNIIKNWKIFFQAEKNSIKKIKDYKEKEKVLGFIDKQIKFFDSLAKKVRK